LSFPVFKECQFDLKTCLANCLTVTFAKKVNMEEKETQQTDSQSMEGVDINSDENIPGTSHLNDTLTEESEVEKLKEELQGQKDKYLRLFAEFDNYKRRTAKERIELIQTAGKEVITSMLDVLDDCDRAEKQLQSADDIKQIKEGVQIVFNKLRTTLQNKGLKAMESIGQEFDTEKHEAITEIPAATADLKGKVVDEVTKGYYLNDKLIRFAKVIVGK
jgi:molecular chaperone GrpE